MGLANPQRALCISLSISRRAPEVWLNLRWETCVQTLLLRIVPKHAKHDIYYVVFFRQLLSTQKYPPVFRTKPLVSGLESLASCLVNSL